MRIRSARFLINVGILSAVLGVPYMHAQVSLVRAGSLEIGPFVGASYGIDETRAMGGGNITFAITRMILPYFEYSYFPGIGRTQTGTLSSGPFSAHYSIPLSDIHGGVHVRIPIRESPVAPYLVFGIGALRASSRHVTATYTSFGAPATLGLDVPGSTDRAINFGGGIRYYFSQRFGMRVEAKAYKPSGVFDQTFGKAEVGFFYQLR
jgi:hypothetical protein